MSTPMSATSHHPTHVECIMDVSKQLPASTTPSGTLSTSSTMTRFMDVSRRRTQRRGELTRDNAPHRVEALRTYVSELGEVLSTTYTEALRGLPPGSVAAVVRVIDCSHRAGVFYVTVEGLTSPGEWTLDLTDTKAPFALYPGKVMMCTGTVFGSHKMCVKEILSVPPPSIMSSNAPSTSQHRVLVAAGPFQNVQQIMGSIRSLLKSRDTPIETTLVILGPLVEPAPQTIPRVSFTDTYMTYLGMFEQEVEVTPSLQRIVVVPSLEDCVSDNVFPQPPLAFESDATLHIMSNPGMFDVSSSLRVGVCTLDAPRHVSQVLVEKESTATPTTTAATTTSRIHRVMDNIVESGLFIPYFPTPATGEDTLLPVDIAALESQRNTAAADKKFPNLLIYSTKLVSCCGTLSNGAVFLNVNVTGSSKNLFHEIRTQGNQVARIDTWKQ
eukprot:PhM_4_TR4108/c0_g1_i1/m.15017/K02321/POLA2; DNA polymerase alpha subunit B